MELTFFDLGVELVVSENLQDLANVVDMKDRIGGANDDVVEDADCCDVQVLPVIHEVLKHSRGVSREDSM